MTTLAAFATPDQQTDLEAAVFPQRLVGFVRDPTVSHRMVALLYSLAAQIEEKGGSANRPAFIQSRDVAYYANLDRKTIFTNKDKTGLTLIARAGAHGVVYQPGSNDRLIEKPTGSVGEAGSYWWPVQVSPTDPGDLVLLNLDSSTSTTIEDNPARDCGGNLHKIEEGLRALTHPGAPLWTSHRAGLTGWRLTCLLVLAHGSGPAHLTVAEAASMLNMSVSATGRVLHRLQVEDLVSRQGKGWTFDISLFFAGRERMMEGKRDPALGLDWRDRKAGCVDKGDTIENGWRSRKYVLARLAAAQKGAAKWFLDHREALLTTAQSLAEIDPAQQPDARWLARVAGLDADNVIEYLSGEPLTQKAQPEVVTDEEMAQRLHRLAVMKARLSGQPPPEVPQAGTPFHGYFGPARVMPAPGDAAVGS